MGWSGNRAARRCITTGATALAMFAATATAHAADTMHEGAAWCKGDMAENGNSYTGTCTTEFQGFPIGAAGVYDSEPLDPADTGQKAAEIHMEVYAKVSIGPPRPLGVECVETTTGTARCELEYNPIGTAVSLMEPAPGAILGIICNAHSHAKYSRLAPPAGKFACWSTDAARKALANDGWFRNAGFQDEPEPEPEPEPGALEPLAGQGVTGHVTSVPINTYAPDKLVVSRSLGLTYTNADTNRHDFVALNATRPDGSAPWCADFEESSDCPLFWTPLIPGAGTQTPVQGLEDTKVGETYDFYCSIHPYMTGTLRVAE